MYEENEMLNTEELATFLKCSIGLINKLKNQGKIPFIKVGSSVRFERNEVLKALREETDDNN